MHPWNTDHLRLSDRERRAALRALQREHRRGRIDAAELDERADAIGSARNHGDLTTVFADLGGRPVFRGAPPARRGPVPFPFPLLPLLVLGIVLAATGHVPWIGLAVVAVLVLVLAPWRRRRWAGRRAGWAC